MSECWCKHVCRCGVCEDKGASVCMSDVTPFIGQLRRSRKSIVLLVSVRFVFCMSCV